MTAKPVKISFEGDESDLVRAFDKAGTSVDGFANEAKSAGDKAERSFEGVGSKADEMSSASSQAAGGLGDLGGALALMPGPLGALGGGMEAAAPAIMGVTGASDLLNLATEKFPILAKAQTIATNTMAGAQRALNAVMAGNPIALVILAIVALIAIFAVLYAKNERFRDLVNAVFGALKARIDEAVTKMGTFLGTVRDKLTNAGQTFTDLKTAAVNAIGTYNGSSGGVLGKVYDIVTAVTSLPGTIREKASGIFGPIREAAVNAIGTYSADGGGVLGKLNDVVSTVTGLGGTIRTKAAGMWDGIGSSFKGTINAMIGWWNNLAFSVDIPDKIPGLPDSFTISTPNIPMLANGGIVNRATLAVIGEAGPEAVIPLDRLRALTGGGGNVYQITVHVPVGASPEDTGRAIRQAVTTFESSNGRRAA